MLGSGSIDLWSARELYHDPWFDLKPAGTQRGDPGGTFEGFARNTAYAERLVRALDPTNSRAGTTLLVTGSPGSGKSTLVNYAIFEAAKRALSVQDGTTILLDVRVPLAKRQGEDVLIRRTLRALYFRLASSCVADANPSFVRTARLAYIRSVASRLDLSVSEKFSASFEAGFNKKGIGLAATQELDLARQLSLHLDRSETHEVEDDLRALLQEMHQLNLGSESLAARAGKKLLEAYKDLREFALGDRRVSIHPIVVFDELDKISSHGSRRSTPNGGDEAKNMDGGVELKPPRTADDEDGEEGGPDFLTDTVSALKTVLTAFGTSFVFIAGPEHSRRWMEDSLDGRRLRSVFLDHFHVGPVSPEEIGEHVLPRLRNGRKAPDTQLMQGLSRALRFSCAGRFRDVARLLRETSLAQSGGANLYSGLSETLVRGSSWRGGPAVSLETMAEADQIVEAAAQRLRGLLDGYVFPDARRQSSSRGALLEDELYSVCRVVLLALLDRPVGRRPITKAIESRLRTLTSQPQSFFSDSLAFWFPDEVSSFASQIQYLFVRSVLEACGTGQKCKEHMASWYESVEQQVQDQGDDNPWAVELVQQSRNPPPANPEPASDPQPGG